MSPKVHLLFGAGAALIVVSAAIAAFPPRSGLLGSIADLVGSYSAKPGWMDGGSAFTEKDRHRLAEIGSFFHGSNTEAIESLVSGRERPSLSPRDFELLRQDRRRAMAAYPDKKADDLLNYGWVNVSLRDKVPIAYCSSGNYSSTSGTGGDEYLDGPCFLAKVNDDYPKRTDGRSATQFLADLKAKNEARRAADRTANGYHFAMSGTGGSLRINCVPGGKCTVEKTDEAGRGSRWTFAYDVTEWAGNPTNFETFPSFKNASVETIK